MTNPVLSRDYTVNVYETGFDGLLQPFSLFNYMQDIAAIHAEKLGFGRSDLLKMNSFWVLSLIEVRINKWPAWKDVVTVTTWPRGTDRLFAVRDFHITGSDGTVIAAATSSWLVIDASTKRIRRPGEELTRYNTINSKPAAIGKYAGKIEIPPCKMTVSPINTVKTGDIDINMHTNNTSYIRWIFDTYDPEFRTAMTPLKIEVNYLSESRYNDNFQISSCIAENNIHYHSVTELTGNKELCRLRIEWVKCYH